MSRTVAVLVVAASAMAIVVATVLLTRSTVGDAVRTGTVPATSVVPIDPPAPPTAPFPPVATRPARLADLADPTGEAAAGPVAVRIEDIGVDATVTPVGVEADGAMEVPPATEIGWYRYGPRPGERGSAVLAAHVDFGGVAGAFFRLRELEPGALVAVDLGDGSTRRFRVTGLRQFPKGELPKDELFAREGPPRLVLITCGGDFDRSAGSYADNVVAYAVPVP